MNEVPDIVFFLGRFHPLVVHLPIGLILFAFLLEILSKWQNLKELKVAIPYALLFGAITAATACVLGYMLSLSGEYDGPMLDGHFWFGIATTLLTLMAWLISADKIKFIKLKTFKANIASLTLLVVLVSVTGHYGGNLTHGSDYLTKYAPFGEKPKETIKPKTVEEVVVFDHIVYPILEDKCISCHNPSKKKGGLSLDTEENILKGGREGITITPGDLFKSDLIHRVTLNPHNKDFMPPEGKTPLTEEEIQLLSFWIENNKADFKIKLVDSEKKDEILKTALAYLELGAENTTEKIPELKPVDSLLIGTLKSKGFAIRELVYNANIFDVVLPSKTAKSPEEAKELLQELAKIKDHIYWLSLENNAITDQELTTIATFTNLRQLHLNKNAISNAGIEKLKTISTLNSLNLYGTKVDQNCFASLLKFKNLEKVYLWQTAITSEHVKEFTAINKKPLLISGVVK